MLEYYYEVNINSGIQEEIIDFISTDIDKELVRYSIEVEENRFRIYPKDRNLHEILRVKDRIVDTFRKGKKELGYDCELLRKPRHLIELIE